MKKLSILIGMMMMASGAMAANNVAANPTCQYNPYMLKTVGSNDCTFIGSAGPVNRGPSATSERTASGAGTTMSYQPREVGANDQLFRKG